MRLISLTSPVVSNPTKLPGQTRPARSRSVTLNFSFCPSGKSAASSSMYSCSVSRVRLRKRERMPLAGLTSVYSFGFTQVTATRSDSSILSRFSCSSARLLVLMSKVVVMVASRNFFIVNLQFRQFRGAKQAAKQMYVPVIPI